VGSGGDQALTSSCRDEDFNGCGSSLLRVGDLYGDCQVDADAGAAGATRAASGIKKDPIDFLVVDHAEKAPTEKRRAFYVASAISRAVASSVITTLQI
jgi:hypothetical protein